MKKGRLDLLACPYCPRRKFSLLLSLNVHISKKHKGKRKIEPFMILRACGRMMMISSVRI